MFNAPNTLTLSRLALLPVITALFFLESQHGAVIAWICFGLYTFCAITDFLDGWIARKYNQISAFGTFLDPISDKIFVGTLLILLVAFGRLDGLWVILPLIIFAREFLISGLREFLGPKNVKMPVTKLAKWKTTAQMVALGVLIPAPYIFEPYALLAGQALLGIAALLTVMTGWSYLKASIEHLK
jgi:cardiolipin synthase